MPDILAGLIRLRSWDTNGLEEDRNRPERSVLAPRNGKTQHVANWRIGLDLAS